MTQEIPHTIVTKELPKYVRMSARKWKELQDIGQAPLPKYRGREGNVYLGTDIKRFLGIIDGESQNWQNDLFTKGLQKLGKLKK